MAIQALARLKEAAAGDLIGMTDLESRIHQKFQAKWGKLSNALDAAAGDEQKAKINAKMNEWRTQYARFKDKVNKRQQKSTHPKRRW